MRKRLIERPSLDVEVAERGTTAHSREQFEGPREVLVAMTDAVRLTDCSPTVEVTTA